ncbi:response regulator [Vibrio diazotrophicus]|uniref:response regulator n=1 Tax=Vibrio diazotrophicus TaxID=685 RepID=UPI000C9E3B0F|nr:HD domain-containing phosphohydrolase [Vibrio diazotrophicus]PNH93666.1 two-component system response regulator [Vibrio diazotrophicus]
MKKKLLIVDDEPTNLDVLKQILCDEYTLVFATNGEKALDVAINHLPDLILLDIMMPNVDGYQVCQLLNLNDKTKSIPVIFITAMSDIEDEAKGFDVGAVDYILKPVSAPIVKRRIKNQLSLVKLQQLEQTQHATTCMLGVAGHFNDTDTGVHVWRMSAYARIIAQQIGWDPELVQRLELASPMHDTGKIGIPDEILKAPRQLSAEEWVIMKTHTEIGHQILSMSPNPLFQMASEIALCHHERWDGTGYPRGLAGEDIPECARIVAIADVFDALTMKRVYKAPWTTEDAIQKIIDGSGSHFDPRLVQAFEDSIEKILETKMLWDTKEFDENLASDGTEKHSV